MPGSGSSLAYPQLFEEQALLADSVCCCVIPDLCVDVHSFHIARHLSYRATSLNRSRGRLCGRLSDAISPCKMHVLGDPTVYHTAHMDKPGQSALSKQCVHGGGTSTCKILDVGHFVADAKDAATTLLVVTVQLLLLLEGGC